MTQVGPMKAQPEIFARITGKEAPSFCWECHLQREEPRNREILEDSLSALIQLCLKPKLLMIFQEPEYTYFLFKSV